MFTKQFFTSVRCVPEAEVNFGILNVGYRECWPLIFITRGTLYKPTRYGSPWRVISFWYTEGYEKEYYISDTRKAGIYQSG